MKIELPATEEGWDKLAAGLLRAHLGMTGASLAELSQALGRLGVDQRVPNLSQKLAKGRFSATFFIQVLIALQVEELDLRVRPAQPRPDASPEPDAVPTGSAR